MGCFARGKDKFIALGVQDLNIKIKTMPKLSTVLLDSADCEETLKRTEENKKNAEDKYKVLENKMKNAEGEREKELKNAQQNLDGAQKKADASSKKMKVKQQVKLNLFANFLKVKSGCSNQKL